MSARLVARMKGPHSFQDDLESSIYVLLWMILMYSETSDSSQVPSFLSGVLDPQPRGETGGFNKADFLKARTFLQQVNFPGRPALHRLINQLGELFAVRYEEKPSEAQETLADFLKKALVTDPNNAVIAMAYKASSSYWYWTRVGALNGHQHTIDLFEAALQDRASWPVNDRAVKQQFQTKTPSRGHLVTKTGWDTTFFVLEMNNRDGIEESEGGMSSSDGSEASDQMTVANDSDVGNISLLPKMCNSDFMDQEDMRRDEAAN